MLAFPGGHSVDPQQELADAPIVRVTPHDGDPWVGIFYAGWYGGPTDELLSWPDEASFCVVRRGLAVRVRADSPQEHETLEPETIVQVHAVPDAGLVLFADHTYLTCHGRNGLVWQSDRLAWDDLQIDSVVAERGVIHARGYDAPGDENAAFRVDLATGVSADKPYPTRLR